MHAVVGQVSSKSHESLAKERTAELRRWAFKAEELRSKNEHMLSSLSPRRQEILSGKGLALFESLLVDAGHGDSNLVQDILNGFDLTGPLPEANVFKKKLRPATIHCSELRKVALTARKAMLRSVASSGDPELDAGLLEATQKEVNKGFLVGPISPDALPQGATLTRRFAVRQKNKIRPIDDYRASMVNASVTQTEGVSVHTVDHIAGMIALWMRLSSPQRVVAGLKAKCWDLSDAYKQLPCPFQTVPLNMTPIWWCSIPTARVR